MKLTSKILVALAIPAVFAVAQSNRDTAEERYRAKYGRNTPAQEAKQAEQQSSTAYREVAPTGESASAAKTWSEQMHRTKLGRPTPAEEKRIEAEKANTAYRDVTTPAEDRWHDNWFRTKYGRPAPAKK